MSVTGRQRDHTMATYVAVARITDDYHSCMHQAMQTGANNAKCLARRG